MVTRKWLAHRLSLIVLLCSLVLVACGGAKAPAAGVWKASADFGSVDFTVNAAGSLITDATFTFNKFQCGPGTQSGSIQVTYGDGLKITGGNVTIELQNSLSSPVPPDPFNPLPPSSDTQVITLTGKFAPDGKSASGTWIGKFNDQTCAQGKWAAAPGK